MPTRRSLIRLAGFSAVVGAAYGGTALLRRLTEPELEFQPIVDLPGFRSIKGGAMSGGASLFIGLEERDEIAPIADSAVCQALFGANPNPSRVQVAYFTDYRCLFCREVSPMLEKVEEEGETQITWHDLPLLGPLSVRAARAAVASRDQGAYAAFHRRLMSSPAVPTPAYLRQLSDEFGIDGGKLLNDMASTRTEEHLHSSAALARRFGFIGTPALVVGRTSVLGGIDRRLIDRLIQAEKDAPQPGPC